MRVRIVVPVRLQVFSLLGHSSSRKFTSIGGKEQTSTMQDNSRLAKMTAEMVSAYLSNNHISPQDVPELIKSVHRSMSVLCSGSGESVANAGNAKPAVPVKRSITSEYIVCLEDGMKFKSLKRHLRSSYGLSPDEYRSKWSLPHDYPMVAPNYAEHRSQLAKQIGLGRQRTAKRR